jgi:hypothetical protein
MKFAGAVVLIGLQWTAATAAMAWGDEGHEVVGLIAEHYLEPSVRPKVAAILASEPDSLTNQDTGDPIADQATWADKYRDENHRRDHYIATRNWHFIDMEIDSPDLTKACFGRPPLPSGVQASDGPANDCAVDKLEQFASELSNPATPPNERVMALRFILHLAGDMHQPLHASDDHDSGGNSKSVNAPGLEPGKLHSYWDTEFVEELGDDPQTVSRNLIARISPADAANWAKGNPEDWTTESFKLAKQFGYDPLPAPDENGIYSLPSSYVTNASAVVATQLSKAGVRLAAILNHALR